MNSGNKPGQRTWYVGGGDEVPEETTAFETQPEVKEETSEVTDKPSEAPDELDPELPTDGIPMTSANDDSPQTDEPGEEGEDFFVNSKLADSDQAESEESDTPEEESELEHTVADLAATPAVDDNPDEVTEAELAAAEEDDLDSLEDKVFGSTQTDDEDSINSSSELARQSVVEQLQIPIDENEKVDTAVHRQSLLDNSDDASSEKDLDWKSTDDEAVKLKKKRDQIDEAIFEGATVRPTVPSRGAAHMWSLLLSVILVPVAWYLMWDAGTRLMVSTNAQWKTGVLDWLAIGELIGGSVAIFVLVLVARWSSLGAFITGILILAAGVPFIALPGLTAERIEPVISALKNGNPFTGNIAHHLTWSGGSGFFVMAGVALIALGFVSHGARRKGRKDFLAKRQVEREKRRRGVES